MCAQRSFAQHPSRGCGGEATRYSPLQVPERKRESTERTPKGYEVPVPKRRDFFANLKKIARPKDKGSAPGGGSKQ